MSRSAEIIVRRPRAVVFDYMNDVEREVEWQPHLVEAEQTPAGATKVGSERRYVSDFMGRRIENVYVVTEFVAPTRVRLETTEASMLQAISEVAWETVPEGTRVTMSIEGAPRGPLKFLPRRVLEATFERELESALERLKEILEESD